MRRLTGTYNGVEYVLLEYADGQVDCPSDLRDLLEANGGTFPTGNELAQACRVLFGETFQVREV